MSRKNLVGFKSFFSCDASTRFGLFEWSIWFLAIFLSFEHRIDSVLHILLELNGVYDFDLLSLMLDHSKIRKMPFWMIQIAKNEVFGHFLEFGSWYQLDISYLNSTKWCVWVGDPVTHTGSFKNLKNAFLNDPNSQKRGFWSSSWVWCIELTWYCVFW